MKTIKVTNIHNFWQDYEGLFHVYYFFKWEEKIITKNEYNFSKEYERLTLKYQIAMPMKDNYLYNYGVNCKDISEIPIYRNMFSILYLYLTNDIMLYPCTILIEESEMIYKTITNFDPNLDILKLENEISSNSNIISISQNKYPSPFFNLSISIGNDIFSPYLDNIKTKNYSYPVDNTICALNIGSRFNSFLRDLKIISLKYGAIGFDFESTFPDKLFTPDGVLFDGEIVYWEDVKDLYPPLPID